MGIASLIFIFFTLCSYESVEAVCPDGWVVYKDSCYLFSHENIDFIEAEHLCKQHGSHLVHIETASENNFIRSFARDLKAANHWIGLTDQVIEGEWRWYDTDTAATFTEWYPGQPEQLRVANCAGLYVTFDFAWDDAPCTDNRQPICERADYLVEHGVGHVFSGVSGQHSFHWIPLSPIVGSEQTCELFTDTADHWIGIDDNVHESQYVWSKPNTVAHFKDWAAGQPDDGRAGNCVLLASSGSYQWADRPCTLHYQPICEKRKFHPFHGNSTWPHSRHTNGIRREKPEP